MPDTPRTLGIQPDRPEPNAETPPPPPAPTSRGVRPDRPVTKGIKPDAVPPPGLSAAEIKTRVDAMVALLADPDQRVRVEAQRALLGMGPAALPALKQARAPNANAQQNVKTIIEALEARPKVKR